MEYDRPWLERQVRAKGRPKFLFFWGHQPAADGRLSASCFSQWWPARFEAEGKVYPTAEHWMMAAKARLFGDDAGAALILAAGRST